jgi:hypothetical protein
MYFSLAFGHFAGLRFTLALDSTCMQRIVVDKAWLIRLNMMDGASYGTKETCHAEES